MRVAFCADVHLGNHRRFGGPVEGSLNRRCKQALGVLGAAAGRASKEKCDTFVIAGDLFDSTRPEPQVIAAAQVEIGRDPKTATIVVRGNHDMVSEQDGDHTLGALSPVAYVIERPAKFTTGDGELFLVPFQSGVASEWLPGALSEVAGVQERGGRPPSPASRVLVLHLGLIDGTTPPWLRDAPDAVPVALVQALCRKHKIGACFAGNWHEHKVWEGKPFVCQIGALVPTGWDNPGLDGYGTLAIWDSRVGFKRHVIPGPRFLKDPDTAAVHVAVRAKHHIYLQLTAKDVESRKDCEQVLESLTSAGVLGEVVQDDAEATYAARAAAVAARSAGTLAESLDAFVREMPLADGVDRSLVLERAKKYLGG